MAEKSNISSLPELYPSPETMPITKVTIYKHTYSPILTVEILKQFDPRTKLRLCVEGIKNEIIVLLAKCLFSYVKKEIVPPNVNILSGVFVLYIRNQVPIKENTSYCLSCKDCEKENIIYISKTVFHKPKMLTKHISNPTTLSVISMLFPPDNVNYLSSSYSNCLNISMDKLNSGTHGFPKVASFLEN